MCAPFDKMWTQFKRTKCIVLWCCLFVKFRFVAMCEDVTHSGVMLSCGVLVPFSVSVFGHLSITTPYVEIIWMRRFWCCSVCSGQCVQFCSSFKDSEVATQRCCLPHALQWDASGESLFQFMLLFVEDYVCFRAYHGENQ